MSFHPEDDVDFDRGADQNPPSDNKSREPSILFLGHSESRTRVFVNAIQEMTANPSSEIRIAYLDTRVKPNGVELHHVRLSVQSEGQDQVLQILPRDEKDGDGENEGMECGSLANLIVTPDLNSHQMRRAQSALKDLILTGVITDVCFVGSDKQNYRGFEDGEWKRWAQFLGNSGQNTNIYVLLLDGDRSMVFKDETLNAEGTRKFVFPGITQLSSCESLPQLLKCFLMDNATPSSHDGVQVQRRLVEHHALLFTACQMLCRFLETGLDGACKISADLRAQIASLHSLRAEASDTIEVVRGRIAELDTVDLEEMEPTTGDTAMIHHRRLWQLGGSPNFKFSITTPFPIREVTKEQSPKSTWISGIMSEIDGCTFTGEVENKWMSDSYARVQLFGWRKEIHVDELNEMRGIERQQMDVVSQLNSLIDSTEMQQATTESLISDFNRQLIPARKDLSVLTDCGRQKWKFRDMQAYIMENTVYGVAKAYGLSSLVQKTHFPTIFSAANYDLRSLFHHQQTLMEDAIQYLETVSERSDEQNKQDSTDKDTTWAEKILESRQGKGKTGGKEKKVGQLAKSTNSHVKKIGEAGLAALKELEKDLDGFYAELQETITEAEQTQNEQFFERRGKVLSTPMAIAKSKLEVEVEHKTVIEIMEILDAEVVELGVFAELIETPGDLAAYWSIWKGMSRVALLATSCTSNCNG